MEYLKAVVYFVGGVLMLVMLAMLFTLGVYLREYQAWRRALDAARARAASGGGDVEDDAHAADAAPLDESLVRSLRVAIRLAMGYFAAEPPEGMPDLLVRTRQSTLNCP
jgi:hypothetical protein